MEKIQQAKKLKAADLQKKKVQREAVKKMRAAIRLRNMERNGGQPPPGWLKYKVFFRLRNLKVKNSEHFKSSLVDEVERACEVCSCS